MSVPNRQIGWSNESNLLWEITKQLDRLTKVTQSSIDNSEIFVADTPTGISITTVGGVVTSFSATPVFNNAYKAFLFSYPSVGLSYPINGEKLQVFGPISYNSIVGSPITEMTIDGIDAIVATSTFAVSLATSKVTMKGLKYIFQTGGSSTFNTSSTLTTILFPDLEFTAVNITCSTPSPITSFSFPKLKVGGLTVQNAAIQTISVPEALFFSLTDNTTNSNIQSINLPKVKTIFLLNLSGTKTSLTSILLPEIEYISGGMTLPTSSTSLSTFTFGSSLKGVTGNFITTSNSLDQASVDNILIRLAALNGTNGTISFNSRTVTITGGAATPSAAGLAAKAILVARGCTVTNN